MNKSALTLMLAALGAPAALRAADAIPDEQLNFFERKIRPVLVEKCYECHSAQSKKVKGGLKLDTRENTLSGGEHGPAVVPGKVDESLILTAIHWTDKDMEMPPKTKLPASVIADFEQWVKMGAPDPRGGTAVADAGAAAAQWKKKEINLDEGRKFWAFQQPKKTEPPQVRNAAWPRSDIDRFTLARMEEKNLQPVPDASKLDLLRRVSFDLTGLPPTPDAIQAFAKDTSPEAFARVVDNLLASDRFGEYWGRHWLDVARYGESSGKDVNLPYPFAWRYRDWVIDAVNRDMPYDEFVRQQIAGDLLPYKDAIDQSRKIVATGFLAIGTKSHNERNPRQFALEVADEQIDTFTQAFLGDHGRLRALPRSQVRSHPAEGLLRARRHLPEQRDPVRHDQRGAEQSFLGPHRSRKGIEHARRFRGHQRRRARRHEHPAGRSQRGTRRPDPGGDGGAPHRQGGRSVQVPRHPPADGRSPGLAEPLRREGQPADSRHGRV